MPRNRLRRCWRFAAAAVVAPVLSSGVALAEAPAVFDERPYAEAKAAAAESDKLFIVDFTAVWCGPCKKMDRVTWTNDRVVEWLDEHAVAVQVDVDQQGDVAQRYRVRAMPTIVAVKDGEEFDRVVGFKDAEGLLTWLEAVERGEREIDALRRAAEEKPASVNARMNLARELMNRGDYAGATDHYVWLWENIPEQQPSMYGVRLSFMLSEIQQLVMEHEPARERFAAIRDRLEATLKTKDKTIETLVDFVALNDALWETERTLAWYDAAKDDPKNQRAIERIASDLEPLLVENRRWADLGRLAGDPVEAVRMQIEQHRMMSSMNFGGDTPEEFKQQMLDMQNEELRSKAAAYHAGCLAADREVEAKTIAALTLKELDDAETRLALVRTALEAEQPRMIHASWLDEAAAAGQRDEGLRERLVAALGPAAAAPNADPLFGEVAWLAGTWRAANDAGAWREHWLAPHSDSMAGVLRWSNDDGVRMYELLAIEVVTPEGGGEPRLEMLIRHFDRGLVPWESEKDGPVRLPAQRLSGDELVWARDDLRVTYTRTGADAMTVRLENRAADGTWSEQVNLSFTR